jgi:hypothetical protein
LQYIYVLLSSCCLLVSYPCARCSQKCSSHTAWRACRCARMSQCPEAQKRDLGADVLHAYGISSASADGQQHHLFWTQQQKVGRTVCWSGPYLRCIYGIISYILVSKIIHVFIHVCCLRFHCYEWNGLFFSCLVMNCIRREACWIVWVRI